MTNNKNENLKETLFLWFPTFLFIFLFSMSIMFYLNPEYGIKPHSIDKEILIESVRDVHKRIFHETTIKQKTNASQVEDLARNLTKDCFYDECKVKRIEEYVIEEINYSMDYVNEFPEPNVVIERGEGRCFGKSIVEASMFKSLGIEFFYVHQDSHICTATLIDEKLRLSKLCFKGEEVQLMSQV